MSCNTPLPIKLKREISLLKKNDNKLLVLFILYNYKYIGGCRKRYDKTQKRTKEKTFTKFRWKFINNCRLLLLYYYFILVTYEEVNMILKSYIILWKKSPDYILDELARECGGECDDIIYVFFEKGINYHQYVIFVCLFCFFNSTSILTVLLSVCGIQSNLCVSAVQIKEFFNKLDIDKKQCDVAIEYLDTVNNDSISVYYLDSFIKYMNQNRYFQSMICYIRIRLIRFIFGEKKYKQIKKKINYFYTGNNEFYEKANCCLSYKRYWKIRKFHADFLPKNIDDNTINNVIILLRQQFGYSNRCSINKTILKTSVTISSIDRIHSSVNASLPIFSRLSKSFQSSNKIYPSC